jgi:hypothetical protein
MDIELLKRLIFYYGAVPVSVGMTYYEDNIVANTEIGKAYNFDIPPGCPWSGIDVYNTFKSLLTYLKVDHRYTVPNPWGSSYAGITEHKMISIAGVPGFWNTVHATKSYHAETSAIFDLREFNDITVPLGDSFDPWSVENVYEWTIDGKTSKQIKTMADKWNNWAKKMGAYEDGHEILLTGWDKTGFKFITWYGTGHMSYEYWYLHHFDGAVVIPKVWDEAMRGFNAQLLLSNL